MKKRIICPTDFSDTAQNAIQYACKLAQLTRDEVVLVHLEEISFLTEALEGVAGRAKERIRVSTQEASHRLAILAEEIARFFDIDCTYYTVTGSEPLTDILSEQVESASLLVIGTNGADSFYQQVFGSNAYQTARVTAVPMLIIPDNYSFATPQKILFAWDYKMKNLEAFSAARNLLRFLEPEFVLLHVSNHPQGASSEIFDSFRDQVLNSVNDPAKVEFDQVFCDDIIKCLDDYMGRSQSDILVLCLYHKFNSPSGSSSVLKKLSAACSYPLLVMPRLEFREDIIRLKVF